MNIIIFFSALILWYASAIIGGYVWLFEANQEGFNFWPAVLMLLPVVNTVFLIVLIVKFVPKDFFSMRKLTDVFKKKEEQ